MSNIFNPKEENKSKILSNIGFIKIIAIFLGFLIIIGLIALFVGLANNYNKIEKVDKDTKSLIKTNDTKLYKFNLLQPLNAQLISTSLGKDNQILLRYIYKGNNVLVLLDSKDNKIKSIITLKKELENW